MNTVPLKIELNGRIDSNNAAQVEQDILKQMEGNEKLPLVLDASKLEYISSAGLRILLHLRKINPGITLSDVSQDVYEILDMTGFTEMLNVTKAYRKISIEGCEEIGHGAHGAVYRIDQENIVKVYYDSDALDEIRHEREVARLALILGIPTAIPYDVVRVGDYYGSVFELLNARSFSNILAQEPDKMDWCVREYVELLKKIHETRVPEGKLPSIREEVMSWVRFLKDYLPEDSWKKLWSLVEAVPENHHMVHGDYHTKNVMVQNDEVLLIDMDTLAYGHPIFELGAMYNAYIGFSETDHEQILKFQGFDLDTSRTFWHKVLGAYLGTGDEAVIREVEDKARVIGYIRLVRRGIRHKEYDSDWGRKELALWKSELLELLERVDSLDFSTGEMLVDADTDHLPKVLSFIQDILKDKNLPMKVMMQIEIAVEEIFVNIANYAYKAGKEGSARILAKILDDASGVKITFIDHGMPYDPLEKQDPDVTLSAVDRPIGGLGIYMTKKTMDELSYEYKDGQNILTMIKYFK